MMVIDSQVHAYEANTGARPWLHVPKWPPHVTGDEMVAAMDAVGVQGAILVSPFSLYGYDASYAMQVQTAHPGRFALIKPVDPDDEKVGDVIAAWKEVPGAVGIRIMVTKESGRDASHPGIDRVLSEAAHCNLPVNMHIWGNIDAARTLIDRHPNTRIVIDHLGITQPRVPPVPDEPWADLPAMLELAQRANAVIKVSGVCTMSKVPYPFDDIWDPLARVFDAWGFDRCLWGTDWTRTYYIVDYERSVQPFRLTDRLLESERELLMGGACSKVYGWTPHPG